MKDVFEGSGDTIGGHIEQLHIGGLHLSNISVGLRLTEQLVEEREHHAAIALLLGGLDDKLPHLVQFVLDRSIRIEQHGVIHRVGTLFITATYVVVAHHLLSAQIRRLLGQNLTEHAVSLIFMVGDEQGISIKRTIAKVIRIALSELPRLSDGVVSIIQFNV